MLLDEAVVKLFLNAVQPVEIEVGRQVVHEVERQSAEVERLEREQGEARRRDRRLIHASGAVAPRGHSRPLRVENG